MSLGKFDLENASYQVRQDKFENSARHCPDLNRCLFHFIGNCSALLAPSPTRRHNIRPKRNVLHCLQPITSGSMLSNCRVPLLGVLLSNMEVFRPLSPVSDLSGFP